MRMINAIYNATSMPRNTKTLIKYGEKTLPLELSRAFEALSIRFLDVSDSISSRIFSICFSSSTCPVILDMTLKYSQFFLPEKSLAVSNSFLILLRFALFSLLISESSFSEETMIVQSSIPRKALKFLASSARMALYFSFAALNSRRSRHASA